VLLIVMTALVLMLMLPGMPKWPIGILLLGLAAAWWGMRQRRTGEDRREVDQADEPDEQTFAKPPPAIGISLGKDLAEAWLPLRPVIAERLAQLRKQRTEASGLIVPPVVIEDGHGIGLLDYEIALFGTPYARGTVWPDRTLAIRTASAQATIGGIEARDPAFGLPGVWIEDGEREHARTSGYTLVDPITVLMTHLTEVVRVEAPLLLTRNDVTRLLEDVRTRQPGLIEELIPTVMSISDIQRVLQNLVSEYVPIRSMELICEILVDVARSSRDHTELTEMARQRLGHVICNELKGDHDQLSVLSLDPRIEAQITDSVSKGDVTGPLVIEPRLAEQLMRKINPIVDAMVQQSIAPVLLCGPTIRKQLRAFFRRSAPQMAIVSVNEVPQSIDLRSFDVVKLDS
jgi:flagellar biosynthesis protein FlhA